MTSEAVGVVVPLLRTMPRWIVAVARASTWVVGPLLAAEVATTIRSVIISATMLLDCRECAMARQSVRTGAVFRTGIALLWDVHHTRPLNVIGRG